MYCDNHWLIIIRWQSSLSILFTLRGVCTRFKTIITRRLQDVVSITVPLRINNNLALTFFPKLKSISKQCLLNAPTLLIPSSLKELHIIGSVCSDLVDDTELLLTTVNSFFITDRENIMYSFCSSKILIYYYHGCLIALFTDIDPKYLKWFHQQLRAIISKIREKHPLYRYLSSDWSYNKASFLTCDKYHLLPSGIIPAWVRSKAASILKVSLADKPCSEVYVDESSNVSRIYNTIPTIVVLKGDRYQHDCMMDEILTRDRAYTV